MTTTHATVTDDHLRRAGKAIDTPVAQLRWQQVAQAIADAEQRGRAEERRAVLDYIGRFPHDGMNNWDTIARGMHYPKTEEGSDGRPG